MNPWSCAGDILRWWRQDVLQVSQQRVASRLSVQPTAFSNWENNARAISLDLDLIDDALGGDGLLKDLLWASGTTDGLRPSQLWSKVYPGPVTPTWMWVRGEGSSIDIDASWGARGFEGRLTLGANGAFVALGDSVPDAPAIVNLSTRGWVDFGRGELKAEMPDAQVYPAGSLTVGEQPAAQPKVPTSWPPMRTDGQDTERWRFADLRQARGLSLVETVERLEAMTGVAVSKDTLRRYEAGIGEPHNRFLSAALDHVLGADGHLGLVTIRRGHGDGAVRFPPYWRSPIWVEFGDDAPTDSSAKTSIRLELGERTRQVDRPMPCLLVRHYCLPTAPLRISAPATVSGGVGLGRRRGVQAIDDKWTSTL